MRKLKTEIHPDVTNLSASQFTRKATRAIVLNGHNILMMYTQRYHDYTLPGGGVDDNEDLIEGLKRELTEETGAQNICNIQPFGEYQEYRPWYKNDYEVMHMISYCYTCNIDKVLQKPSLEDYEIKNGMKAVWINIFEAIAHNQETIKNSHKKGLSIERETFLLKRIVSDCLTV